MKILLTADGYPTSTYPANTIFVFDQAKALKKKGYDVVLAVVDVRSLRRKRAWGYRVLSQEGIKIYVFNFPLGRVPLKILDFFRLVLLKYLFRKILKFEGRCDIVHAHFALSIGYATAKTCRDYQLPYVVTEHGSNVHVGKISSYSFNKLCYTYRNAAKVLAVSHALARKIFQLTSVKAQIVPNIIDLNCFIPSVKVRHKGFHVISVGNLVKSKGMDILITAFIEAFEEDQNVKLFVCGDGVEREYLKKLIIREGFQDRIFLLGMVHRSKIAEVMQICDCFALVSYSETFGISYIEALAMGLPVIGTLCGGAEDFITKNTGMLVPVADKDSLKKALLEMRDNHNDFKPEYLRDYVVQKYSPQVIAKEISNVYQQIVQCPIV